MNSSVLPTSLIILKNSIIEGRIPTSNNLEVGELALGLFKGQESIWAKNSSNEVVNLRSPRHDLFWGDLFLNYNTREEFELDLNSGIIKNTAIVFIKNTKQLWADGIFYGTEITWEDIENYILSQVVILPEEMIDLIDECNSDIEENHNKINQVFKGKLNFIRLIRNLKKKPYVLSLKLSGGTLPIVHKSSEDLNNKIYIFTLEYYFNGFYNKVNIKLENDLFSITKESFDLINVGNNITNLEERINALENNGIPSESIKWTEVIE